MKKRELVRQIRLLLDCCDERTLTLVKQFIVGLLRRQKEKERV